MVKATEAPLLPGGGPHRRQSKKGGGHSPGARSGSRAGGRSTAANRSVKGPTARGAQTGVDVGSLKTLEHVYGQKAAADQPEVDTEEGFQWKVFLPQLFLRLLPPLMLMQLVPHARPRADESAVAVCLTLIVLSTTWSFALGLAALLLTMSASQIISAAHAHFWTGDSALPARVRGILYPLVGAVALMGLHLMWNSEPDRCSATNSSSFADRELCDAVVLDDAGATACTTTMGDKCTFSPGHAWAIGVRSGCSLLDDTPTSSAQDLCGDWESIVILLLTFVPGVVCTCGVLIARTWWICKWA